MTLRHNIHPQRTALLLLAALLTACDDESYDTDAADVLTLQAWATPYVAATRASESDIAYRIYAIADPAKDWTATDNNLTATTDTAGCLGRSDIGGGYLSGDALPGRFNHKSWYFYGLTTSSSTDPQKTADTVTLNAGVPAFTFSYDTEAVPNALPDVRYAATGSALSIDQTQNGVIPLQFRHALAKLIVRISGATKSTTEVTDVLQKFYVYTHRSGDLNMKSGGWTFPEDDELVAMQANADEVEFGTTMVTVTEEFLVFPTSELKISAVIDGHTIAPVAITQEVTENNTTTNVPINIEANHVYTINLQYIEDGIYIVTAHPDYYDYVTASTSDVSLGNPTLFNGVVWADRNIGATSATYGNIEEWEEMRGYYYQAGRNIPFKPYPVAGNERTKTCNGTNGTEGYKWIQTSGDVASNSQTTADKGRYLYPYIADLWDAMPKAWNYTSFSARTYNFRSGSVVSFLDSEGNVVTDAAKYLIARYTSGSTQLDFYVNLPATAVATTEEYNRYRYISNTGGKNEANWGADVTHLWDDPDTQPCPPGWRIPTDDEWRGILPGTELTGDITCKDHKNLSPRRWYAKNEDGDPTSGYSSLYYCTKTSGQSDAECGVMYIIKKAGTTEAYGLRLSVYKPDVSTNSEEWPDNATNATRTRCVLLIDRYAFSGDPTKATLWFNNSNASDTKNNIPATVTTDYGSMLATKDTDGNQTIWYPIEQLKLPVCGVCHYNYATLIWSGTEAQYATAEGHSVRMKVGGSEGSRSLYIDNTSLRTAGLSIRPVRDAAVQW